ncbi:DNA polymerase/3'-5' exonuclease PolX [Maribius pontilimi]|uniref:DNA polymerase beta n=1 Tax=Palleronia pontilimi TaxID=1964209 RepID=A0A934MCH9_9RHOB|nr:DNA polymerase/3'-5' exonuclease PolX [Palleronia pontilimi]MBJ3762525.1 DNA polymerase/3'-5' exonuclease PolX [Palleronia pontilimi]
MPVHNSEIAAMFDHVADLLEIQDANPFRVRAYRNAADTVRDQSRSVAAMLDEGADLAELPDIGDDLAGKIAVIVRTGHLALLDEISDDVPEAIVAATRIPGIGPKRARKLFDALDLTSLDDLEKAAEDGRIARIAGFGEKTQARIRDELARGDITERRLRIDTAEEFGEPLLAWIRGIDGMEKAEIAGSYRRRKETVGDLDILVAGRDGGKIIERFTAYDEVEDIASKGKTRSTVTLRSGLQVDLRVIPSLSWGAALHYFTGSKAHNIAGRRRAQDRGLKLNEYGLFKGDEQIAGANETQIYDGIGLPWIDPVLRENRGEIEAAENGQLPDLVELGDVKGDLHAHTTASDGKNTLCEMAAAAKRQGYEYLAITDHSKSQTQAGGLGADELAAQIDAIAELNEKIDGIRLLAGCEVDILKDGGLDFHDSLLERLDLVVASVHSNFALDEDAQTERIIRAMDNPLVHIIGHPTGRLIGQRRAYALDIERLVGAARTRGCALELNANPIRLDLKDVHCRLAAEHGVRIAISTDAHSTGGLDHMRYGIDQARRGWLERGDVLNTLGLDDLVKALKRN